MPHVDPWLTPVTATTAEQRDAQALYTLVSDVLAAEAAPAAERRRVMSP
ncbi:MAG: hypothetical protein QM811_15920 [Pirellulales bacterium]